MPWSNQTGGGGWNNGGNNNGPWGQGPRNSGPNPPDLEELLRRSQDKLKRVLPGGGGGSRGGVNPVVALIIVVAAVALIGYNFFTFRVEANQVGLVLRFGEFDRQVGPGLSFRLPYPIETVYTPSVTEVRQTTVGSIPGASGGRDASAESLMLTGDENIVDIDFSVQWVINNARDYQFNVQNVEGTVKATAESAMREVIGRSDVERVLTEERLGIQTQVQDLIQQRLNQYGAGVQITQVQLLNASPPPEVVDAFRDVQAAEQDQDRLRNEAQTYSNRVLPNARGQASQIVEAANAYRDQSIAIARGQGDRFVKVYESYKAAPDLTRQRMYLETMANILANTDKVIVDEKAGTGVVPYLPLPALSGAQPAAAGNAGAKP
ncbi:membrane protease subunit HflK [Kaistia hirudinis]|uniref:Protein HflK n=1 Tax=Kaistia hirudinis TaxID=1293440 RepID=A0A840AXA0_9HYPH|nr:FtsH protease activity modulator HflK [Kaistia hirudinis]MBB3932876.1 membrane protease subunit HflK [Kaistia hirudinis]